MRELVADVQLPAGAAGVAAARTALRSLLHGWGLTDDEWVYDATLIVSELVSNAVRHGGGALRLRVHADDGRVRLAVTDTSTEMPHRGHGDERAPGGRGLTIVDAFAEDWGADVHDDGKQVWVRLTGYPQ